MTDRTRWCLFPGEGRKFCSSTSSVRVQLLLPKSNSSPHRLGMFWQCTNCRQCFRHLFNMFRHRIDLLPSRNNPKLGCCITPLPAAHEDFPCKPQPAKTMQKDLPWCFHTHIKGSKKPQEQNTVSFQTKSMTSKPTYYSIPLRRFSDSPRFAVLVNTKTPATWNHVYTYYNMQSKGENGQRGKLDASGHVACSTNFKYAVH